MAELTEILRTARDILSEAKKEFSVPIQAPHFGFKGDWRKSLVERLG